MTETKLRSIHDMPDVRGKRVMVRASLDVPIANGVVQNTFRVTRALPTITALTERGAKVILLSHVGRDPQNSTKPLLAVLENDVQIRYVDGVIGDNVRTAVELLGDGEVLLLENLRRHTEEEENNEQFAQTLASYADYYVNDAFAVSHRAHASIVGVSKHIPGFGGITFMEEYTELKKAFAPQNPSLFILGGAKFETKAPLIEKYVHTYTHAFIGGANANDLLKGKGYEVGQSLLSDVDLSTSPLIHNSRILLPTDVLAVSGDVSRVTAVDQVLPHEKILDIGTQSLDSLAPHIKEAKTILWNGPLGYYEGGYDAATKACAKLIAESGAFSVVGGGDTVAAIESLGISDQFGFLSTAGGAMLEFLEKQTLPGIEALQS